MRSHPGEPIAVRLPNWVGDACMALPAIRRIREAGHPVTVLGRGWAGSLFAGQGVTTAKLPQGLFAAAAAWKATGCRSGLLLTNSFSSALVARLAAVRATGYRGDGRRWLLAQAPARRRGLHEAEVFWHLAGDLLGQGERAMPSDLGLRPTNSQVIAAQKALATTGLDKTYWVLCPLAVGQIAGRSKVWPGFPLLARMLAERGTALVACPGPGEEAATAGAVPQARLLPGLDLGTYAAVCAGAAMTVANDSGPMHLAAATGAPVLGVFGPGDPTRTRPWGARAAFLGGGGHFPSVSQVAALADRMVAR